MAGIELTDTLAYSIGTVAMGIGFVVATYGLAGSRGLADVRERIVSGRESSLVYGLMCWVCGVAALSYFGMTLGVGAFTYGGHYVETLRYVDWALTTPALVAVIGILAGAERRTVAGAAAADFLMIAVGYGASLASGSLKWLGFVVSFAFFVVLAYYLFVLFGRTASEETFDRQALFEKVRNLTGVLWFVYPAVWVAGPSALGLTGVAATGAIVTYLDVTAKTGYALLLASSQGMFDEVLGRAESEDSEVEAVGGD